MWNLNGISILEGKGQGLLRKWNRDCQVRRVARRRVLGPNLAWGGRVLEGAGSGGAWGPVPVQISFFGF